MKPILEQLTSHLTSSHASVQGAMDIINYHNGEVATANLHVSGGRVINKLSLDVAVLVAGRGYWSYCVDKDLADRLLFYPPLVVWILKGKLTPRPDLSDLFQDGFLVDEHVCKNLSVRWVQQDNFFRVLGDHDNHCETFETFIPSNWSRA